MSTNITKYKGKPLDKIWGFCIEHCQHTGNLFYGHIDLGEKVSEYKIQGLQKYLNWGKPYFLWSVKVKVSKNKKRFIPIEDFDKFIGDAYIGLDSDYLRNLVLQGAIKNFDYSPIRFEDVY